MDRSIRYEPPSGFIGVDSFTYTIQGPTEGRLASARVVLEVIPLETHDLVVSAGDPLAGFADAHLAKLSTDSRWEVAVDRFFSGYGA
jgi:hypothetical protein